jgi:hypothetical protein
MALWLGKSEVKEEDFSKFFKERKKLMEFYLDDMKFRITLKLSHDELNKFEQAVVHEYGSFSALNSRKAAHIALKEWIENILSK